MAQVLLLWQNIPEDTEVYRLDLEGDELTKVLSLHGTYGGADMDSELYDFIGSKLYDPDSARGEGPWRKYAVASWGNARLDFSGTVVISGQLL
jgi:hypothetical protein